MYCGQCGTPNHEEAGHCETCGAPLLITTGVRSCANCGASLGDNDRFCTSCGTATSGTETLEQYDASDDFGELNIDDIQLDELPDWLQGMAPTAREEPAQPQPQLPSHPPSSGDQPSPDDLPDWLRETPSVSSSDPVPAPPLSAPEPPPTAPSEGSGVDHQPADQFSLVSDEDLPDWLKALSDDDDSSSNEPAYSTPSQSGSSSGGSSQTTAVANLFEVPAISRAWMTQGRSVNQDDVSAARQEFMPLEAVSSMTTRAADEAEDRQSIWDSGPIEPAEADQETRPFTVPPDEEQEGNRRQLIVRVVILALLIIVVLLLGFVLLQGI